MQSGISASSDLHTAFATFTSDPSLFALPVTISDESLTPLPHIPFFSSSPANSTLESSLPLLEPHVHPKNPCYLLLRTAPETNSLVAVTYIPSSAPVRSKTLFAATRTTLVRALGLEKFSGGSLFCTDAREVLDPREWAEREARGENLQGRQVDEEVLTHEERELQGVKRAEDEERHGTKGRDLMGGGETAGGGGSVGVQMKTKEDCQTPMRELKRAAEEESSGGMFVHFGIDIPTESLSPISTTSPIPPSDLPSRIPADKPAYIFYQYPSTAVVIFIYTCPPSSKIKERMLYSSCRRSVLELARAEGVEVAKRLEADGPADITEERLMEEAGVREEKERAEEDVAKGAGGGRQGFARPKRPGKR